jgi:hypothetical protein
MLELERKIKQVNQKLKALLDEIVPIESDLSYKPGRSLSGPPI